ncbi:hypothetical protein LTR65_005320 [Meristemomyces frigidus]
MKRKEAPTTAKAPAKKARAGVPEYHLTPSVKEENGSVQWPAPKAQMDRARQIILDAKAQKTTLIAPDKDADGLSSGATLRHTLMLLGLPAELIVVHLLSKGNNIHTEEERKKMASHKPSYVFVGTHGDLGNTLKWEPPFPDMQQPLKRYTKKVLNDVVSAVNAPRRTATYDVQSAWDALCDTSEPASVLKNTRLQAARAEVNAEVERCTHTAPKFSPDGKVAVFRIKSEAQVHPVIATRWSGHLNSKALEIVMVANEGYLPGKVNFSCRIPRCARNRDPPISIIERLRYYASLTEPASKDTDTVETGNEQRRPLLERLGDDFARGHVQASGGIVNVVEFEELMRLMEIGVKPPRKGGEDSSPAKKKKAGIDAGQKNTLMGYFGKANNGTGVGA